jgi:hypothetical protein
VVKIRKPQKNVVISTRMIYSYPLTDSTITGVFIHCAYMDFPFNSNTFSNEKLSKL